jgi:hypothetical protein
MSLGVSIREGLSGGVRNAEKGSLMTDTNGDSLEVIVGRLMRPGVLSVVLATQEGALIHSTLGLDNEESKKQALHFSKVLSPFFGILESAHANCPLFRFWLALRKLSRIWASLRCPNFCLLCLIALSTC